MTDRKAFQVLESVEADFEAMTWTFRVPAYGEVGGGNYAILPVETFMDMSTKLAVAEGLLKRALAGEASLRVEYKEAIESYFDPKPLA